MTFPLFGIILDSYGNNANRIRRSAKPCRVLGNAKLCSIVNAFQHVHTPITIIFLRELLGIVIGTAIGMLIGVLLPNIIEEGEST